MITRNYGIDIYFLKSLGKTTVWAMSRTALNLIWLPYEKSILLFLFFHQVIIIFYPPAKRANLFLTRVSNKQDYTWSDLKKGKEEEVEKEKANKTSHPNLGDVVVLISAGNIQSRFYTCIQEYHTFDIFWMEIHNSDIFFCLRYPVMSSSSMTYLIMLQLRNVL